MKSYHKAIVCTLFSVFIYTGGSAQKDSLLSLTIDTVISNDIYVSYYSFEVKNPIYVTYKLYKGGGDCSRKGMKFKDEKDKRFSSNKDYTKSGFDRGHLANAEDFAGNCEHLELTFRFYNCLPQYHNLNAGVWNKYEKKIRTLSQKDSLLVICGGIYYQGDTIAGKQTAIPRYCFKLVKSLSTNKLIYCLVFTNKKEENTVDTTLSYDEFEEKYSTEIQME